jgi:starch-binding outer membrane protein, SusD/RagB family
MIMKLFNFSIKYTLYTAVLIAFTACNERLNTPPENKKFSEETDYTLTGNMILPLLGAYAEVQDWGWEVFPVIAVRGDDVNAGGKDDQPDIHNLDDFKYGNSPLIWIDNSVWQGLYKDIFVIQSAMEQVLLYKEFASNTATADQYIAEAKVLRAFELFQLSRLWGGIFLPTSSDPSDLLVMTILPTKDEVMQHISDQMDEAIPFLPDMRPNERTDIPGGVTKYTALAIKALANLELKNYQGVADATSQIISSGKFTLEPDFYQLFKLKGKLNNENLFELQYSDFGQGSGTVKSYLYAFFGPQGWTPSVAGAGDGWGFWEPSLKYIKFMLDRGEQVRLQTSVLFTNRGIAEIKSDPEYATLPAWITNTTPSGDVINDYARAMFASGKHYLPSNQLTPGRTDYGTNKNFTCIRYAEILLMHAEALTQGATGTGMTADQAINAVRNRAGLTPLTGVTNAQVMDEKFAELAMEWGTRYYDMVRLGKYSELSYEGRTFSQDLIFLDYPQAQKDKLPILQNK